MLFLATVIFAVVLRWPVLSIDRETHAQTPAVEDPLFHVPPAWLLPLDDAYIFIRYAQQAARGRLFQWSDGELSTGSTSLVFLLLHLPGQWLFDGVAGWSWWGSWLGLLSLWALGLAGLRLLRAASVAEPWPLAAGLALVWSGPIAWVSIAGMDSALGCAALLWAAGSWILACRPEYAAEEVRAHLGLLVAVAALPLFRPDFAVATGLAALALLARLGPELPRWSAVAVLLPGLLSGALNWSMTGHFAPGGAIAKSILPLSLTGLADIYGLIFLYGLAPVYAGLETVLLPPPVGWLAAAMGTMVLIRGVLGNRFAGPDSWWPRLVPLAILWLALVATAPLSGYLTWQYLRHHHPGLACAWLLAAAALAWLQGAVRRRGLFAWWRHSRPLILALPCLLWLNFHTWSFDFFLETVSFYQNNGRTAEWLAQNRRDELLLLHDAGLLAVAHDGPAIDVVGLGTSGLARPFRSGPGAIVETLARRDELPSIAAVWNWMFDVPGLLGPPLFEVPSRPDLEEGQRLRVLPLYRYRLTNTALAEPGLDLAYLPDERRLPPEWTVEPPGDKPTYALTLLGADGRAQTQGCRPLFEAVRIELPGSFSRVRVRAASKPGGDALLSIGTEDRAGRRTIAEKVAIPKDHQSWAEVVAEVGDGQRLVVENKGAQPPCLESIAFRR